MYFEEKQRFRSIWLWLVIIGASAASIIPLCYEAFDRINGGAVAADSVENSVFWVTFVFVAIVMSAIVWLFYSSSLQTRIDQEGIHYKFFPFIRSEKSIPWNSIAEIAVRTYRPIAEYGGWGVRFGPNGTAYNVSGSQGLQLTLTNGSKLLIGTQKADELQQIIDRHVKTV